MLPTRIPLILGPTPLHPLPRASTDLGIDLWIKRDDLTGLAMGGNKGRKLEYLIAEAIAAQADVIVSSGAMQSNFIRQLGAVAAMFGIRCVAAVMGYPHPPGKRPNIPASRTGKAGNLLLDEILGVEIHPFPDGTWDELEEAAEGLALREREAGNKVYLIPLGGSSPLGAYAFMRAAEETDYLGKFDWILFASSSGSTHAGLAYAFHGSSTRVVGICSDPEPEIVDDLAKLTEGLDRLTGYGRPVAAEYLDLRMDYVGEGYGVPSKEGNEAIRYLARAEGIFLDPVYTGKAFAGLTDLARRKEIKGRILFWHTGGVPALFA